MSGNDIQLLNATIFIWQLNIERNYIAYLIIVIFLLSSCYVMNDCGVINSICIRVCHKAPGGAKDLRNMEEGER